MKKDELIKYISEIQPSVDSKQLKKCKKKELDELYNQLKSGITSSSPKHTEKNYKLIEFSDSDMEDVDDGDKTEELPEELPETPPLLTRQDAQVIHTPRNSPTHEVIISKNEIKNEIKKISRGFSAEIKELVDDYREHNDKDLLIDRYNLLLKDTEGTIIEYLEYHKAEDSLYNFSASLLDTSTRFIQRIVK